MIDVHDVFLFFYFHILFCSGDDSLMPDAEEHNQYLWEEIPASSITPFKSLHIELTANLNTS